MILFGSTIQTAKESYQILFPHFDDISATSQINEMSVIASTMLELVQVDGLLNIEETLPITNVFILFKRRKQDNEERQDDLIELRNFKLAKSCRQFNIKFRDPYDFEIFDDNNFDKFKDLSLKESNWTNKTDQSSSEEIWYQSKAYVKGFKDSLVNNKTIWN
jgi:hypothetical protein